jgi:hypothetical protein
LRARWRRDAAPAVAGNFGFNIIAAARIRRRKFRGAAAMVDHGAPASPVS